MPTPTYDLIASNVLTSSASSVTFSSIPATYRDLVLVVDAIANATPVIPGIRLNSDTGSNYPYVEMRGDGSSAESGSGTLSFIYSNATINSAGGKSLSIFQLMDYSATDKHKSVLVRGNSPAVTVRAIAARWANTAAVNTILVDAFTANGFASGSTFYLYVLVS